MSIKYFVEHGAHLDYGIAVNPIECAILKGSVDSIDILIMNGVDLFRIYRDGCSSLHYAVLSNDDDKLDRIISFFKSNIDITDDLKKTPLMYAAKINSGTFIKKLIEYGANVNACDNIGVTPLMIASSNSPFMRHQYLLKMVQI